MMIENIVRILLYRYSYQVTVMNENSNIQQSILSQCHSLNPNASSLKTDSSTSDILYDDVINTIPVSQDVFSLLITVLEIRCTALYLLFLNLEQQHFPLFHYCTT